jgi:hypothetical protein
MEANKIKNRLIEIQQLYPALTFDNNGYEYLSKEIRDNHKEQIDEISFIIKKIDSSFVKFFNFKPRKNGSFAIRYDYYYDKSFIGVNYLEIDKL